MKGIVWKYFVNCLFLVVEEKFLLVMVLNVYLVVSILDFIVVWVFLIFGMFMNLGL